MSSPSLLVVRILIPTPSTLHAHIYYHLHIQVIVGGWVGGAQAGVQYADRELQAVRSKWENKHEARRQAVLGNNNLGEAVRKAARPFNEDAAEQILDRKRKQVREVGLRAQREPVNRDRVNMREAAAAAGLGLGIGGRKL